MEWSGGGTVGTDYGDLSDIAGEEMYEYLYSDRYERNYGLYRSMWKFRFLFDMIFFNLNLRNEIC